MEAASIPAGPPASQRIRALIGTYGLTLILLALPIVYAIQDLADDGNLVRLGENLVAGVSNGSIWALVAIGYTLVYGIVELINFAHGEIFMIGSFISASFFATIGLHEGSNAGVLFFGILLTLIIAMIGSGVLNAMIERVAYKPLRNAPKLAPLITAVGFSFILQNVGLLWKGGSQVGIPDLINAQHTIVTPSTVNSVCWASTRSGTPCWLPPFQRRPTFCRMKDMPTAVISGASFGALRRGR